MFQSQFEQMAYSQPQPLQVHKIPAEVQPPNGIFECIACRQLFDSTAELHKHAKQHDTLEGGARAKVKRVCPLCGKTYTFLWGHLRAHYLPHVACPKCPKILVNERGLEQHLKIHAKPRYECCRCRMTFKGPIALARHVCTVCRYCSRKMSSRRLLDFHVRRFHSHGQKTRIHRCSFCGIKYLREHQLQRHLARMHRDGTANVFECDLDGRLFTHKFYLKMHMRSHASPSACKVCGARVKRMDEHVRHVHSGRKYRRKTCTAAYRRDPMRKFACSQCDSVFFRSYHLKQHLQLHANEKAFKCTLCSYACNTSRYLYVHVQTHNKERERKHRCTVCDYASDRRSNLERHMRNHEDVRHDEGEFEENPLGLEGETERRKKKKKEEVERRFRCTECDYASDRAGNLKTHIRNQHSNIYRCLDCDFETKDKELHRGHIAEFTHRFKVVNEAKPPIKCTMCMAVLNGDKAHKQHLKRAHKVP